MAIHRFYSPTLAVLAVAFAAAPWLFLAFPPWAASIAWAATAATGVFTYLAERRRWHRDRQALARERDRAVETAEKNEAEWRQNSEANDAAPGTPAPAVPPDDLPRERVRFAEAAAFAGYSLINSQEFTRGEVGEVLTAFQALGAQSLDVQKSVSDSFATLRDRASPHSLEGIILESKGIAEVLKEFFVRLERLQGQTRGYLQANTKELGRVKDMASTIEEFFENIRMISLNLSIEASRIGSGSGGKALQVLAQRLRDFSNQAQEISAQQRQVVDAAAASLAGSETELNRSFGDIATRVHPLQDRLDRFPQIIAGAHARFDEILLTLAQLTESVQSVLRERLGHLQFQDLTRQEHEHLAQLLDYASRLAGAAHHAGAEVLREERLTLAREFNRMATTANERQVLLAWLDRNGLDRSLVDVQGDDHEAGKVMMF